MLEPPQNPQTLWDVSLHLDDEEFPARRVEIECYIARRTEDYE